MYTTLTEINSFNIGMYNGIYAAVLGVAVSALIPELALIYRLVGIGAQEKLTIWVAADVMLQGAARYTDVENLSWLVTIGGLSSDYIANKVEKGDIEVYLCVHRGGYLGLVEDNTATFVMKKDGNPVFEELGGEFGYGNKLE